MKLEVVTLNVCGLQSDGRYLKFLIAAKRWAEKGKSHVICVQSHNLNPAKQEEHERLAQSCGFTLKIGYAYGVPYSKGWFRLSVFSAYDK